MTSKFKFLDSELDEQETAEDQTQNFQQRHGFFQFAGIRSHRRHSTDQTSRTLAQRSRMTRSMSLPTYNEVAETNLPTYDEATNNEIKMA